MRKLGHLAGRLWRGEGGLSSVEYALLLAFVAGGIALAGFEVSRGVSGQMAEAAACLDGTSDAAACAIGDAPSDPDGDGDDGDGDNGDGHRPRHHHGH